MEHNKLSNNILDEDCYIVENTEISKSNDNIISKTALETTAAASNHTNSSSSSNISAVCTSRGRAHHNCKESTSINFGHRQNYNPYVPPIIRNNHNLIQNPFIDSLVNSHSFYQSRGLALLNLVPPVYNQQLLNYATQRFRNESLFSEQDTVSSDAQPHRNASSNALNWKELKDREVVNELRSWIPVNDPGSKPGVQFTLLSYNVLAQDLLVEHEYIYRQHEPRALLWENRWKNLYQEILENTPDIICLQEVQQDHLKNYFSQFLKKGYAYMFKKKTGMRSDGCAIYYKHSVFKLIENTTVEFNQQFPVLDRDNVAIIAKFAPVHNRSAEFVVATTHLLYNPRREDIRVAQTQVLLSEIDRIAYQEGKINVYTPVIITGDFNTKPNSALYQLLIDGSLQYDILSKKRLIETNSTSDLEGKVLIPPALRVTDKCQHYNLVSRRLADEKVTRQQELKLINIRHTNRQNMKTEDVDDETLFSTGVLSHDLKLQSAFLHTINNETEATTYQNQWITVDYIFYSGAFNKGQNKVIDDKLKLISRYSIPTSSELANKVHHIPNFALGSDHLALLTKFKLEY